MKIKNRQALINNTIGHLKQAREDAICAVETALDCIDPADAVKHIVKSDGRILYVGNKKIELSKISKIFLIAPGKASVKMAKSLLSTIKIDEGVVVSNVKCDDSMDNIEFIKATHPLPDESSIYAGEKILNIADKTDDSSFTFVLISGGGSSLVESSPIKLKDIQKTTKLLLNAGADITEINTLRKHLSNIKGGKLLNRLKGKVVSLIISDVVGNDLSTISSGITYFDSTTYRDAYNVLEKYEIRDKVPKGVINLLSDGVQGKLGETLKEAEFILKDVENIIIADNYKACRCAVNLLSKRGYLTFYLGSHIQGESKNIAHMIGRIALDIAKSGIHRPVAIVCGGEATVNVRGNGIGGRMQELSLAVSPFLNRIGALFLSFGTDGIDGMTDAAGAIADRYTIKRALNKRLNYKKYLNNNDSYNFFSQLDDLIFTGPTQTNVADICILLICSFC